jgi:hypothetical protein
MVSLLPDMGFLMGFLAVFVVIGIAAYVYFALALMAVAKKLKDPQPWLAWIPIANMVLIARLAKMHWWPVLLLIAVFIPIVGFVASIVLGVFMFIWMWKVLEALGKPGWWVLLTLIPFVGGIWQFIMWGIMAWGE